MPKAATDPCSLPRLPDNPTLGDLEVTLGARGAALVSCDGRRKLALDTAAAEHALQDQWAALERWRQLPLWKRLFARRP